VFFELKRNLKKKVEFDRLVGQIEGIDPRRHNIFIVLMGQLDASLVARLKERYDQFLTGMFSRAMVLIEVP
jgi:hypothetical protein